MQAFIHRMRDNGTDELGTYPNGRVSNEYKSFRAFKRYALDNLERGYNFHVELFYNWNNRYGTPDKDFVHSTK